MKFRDLLEDAKRELEEDKKQVAIQEIKEMLLRLEAQNGKSERIERDLKELLNLDINVLNRRIMKRLGIDSEC